MRNLAAAVLVFLGGFAIMVLEIVGARYLPTHFGSSFNVWVSQIGVILTAATVLTLGLIAPVLHRPRAERHTSWREAALSPAARG